MDKGIILTTYRCREDDCIQEAWTILNSYGDFDVLDTNMPGIVLIKINFNPIDAVESLIDFARENPWSIKYILRAIPLEAIVDAHEDSIVNAALSLVYKIKEEDRYRISVSKRNSDLSSMKLISRIAEKVRGKVDLKNYDYMILIEVIKEIAGVSVIKNDQIFALHKIKKEAISKLLGKEVNLD